MVMREIEIEFRLTRQLSGSEFERFGNQYLRYFYKDKYPQTKLGLQIANNSTVAGQPDMYFSLPDHKFRFAEITAQKGGLYTKLKTDIKFCLDECAHGVELARIKHIDLVYAGRLKSAKQEVELAKLPLELGISVSFHGLDQLVNAIVDDIRLAKTLGMPIETGQILTVAEFIEHYERGRLTVGTPLSNAYLERTEYDILAERLNGSDIVVIQGKPGFGKTKLALEYLQRYMVEKPGSEGYCIVNQPPAIWDDVLTYFPDGKDYVILIDDANRQVENLITVLSHFDRLRRSTYKILITVRGYAFDEVCQTLETNNYRFSNLTVGQMSDEQITEVLKSPSFTILNGHYHYKINRLAQGNVRLAIILATLAKQEGYDITILSDVSAVYDEYYRRVLPDQTIWSDLTRLRVLGLTAVLRVVDTTNPNDMEPVLSFLGITAAELWGHIRHLETLEVIEVYQDNAFRFTEQVFATYAFYNCFFSGKASDLAKLLTTFNDHNGYRLKDSILSVYESYNKELIRAWVQPILTKFYTTLTDDRLRLNFLSMYDRFLLDEVVYFVLDFVEGRVTSDTISHYGLSANKQIIDLLFAFLQHTKKKADALIGYELMIALLDKQMVTLEDIGKKIESYLVHGYDSIEYDRRYEQYDWLSEYLVEWANKDSYSHSQLMDVSLKHFLTLVYDKPGKLPVYRNRVWGYVDTRLLAGVESVKVTIYEYMPKGYGNLSDDEIQTDIEGVTKLICKHFSPDNPLDCRNVQGYVHKLNKLSLTRRPYQSLAAEFNGELYQLYCTLSFKHLKMRERIELDIIGSTELRKRKIDEIRTALAFDSLEEFKALYDKLRLMWSLVVRSGDGWNVSEGLTVFFLLVGKQDARLFTDVLEYVLSVGLPDGYIDHPPLLATIIEREYVSPEELYATLLPVTDKTASWLISLFWSLPESQINADWFYRLDEHLPLLAIYQPNRVAIPGFLKRYFPFDSTLPSKVLQMLSEVKLEQKEGIWLWDDFIEKFGLLIDPSLTATLEQLYLDQCLTKQAYDYNRKALAVLLDRRRDFWVDFLTIHYPKDSFHKHDFGQLSFIWSRDDYYELITEGLQLIKQQKVYMIHSQEVESFFENINLSNAEKVSQFLERYIRENSHELDLLNAIYIASFKSSHCVNRPFITIFLTYNTSVEEFAQIDWIKIGGVRTCAAATITGDIHAQQWEEILVRVETMDKPLTYLPHRRYIKALIEREREFGNSERRINFLQSRY